MRVRSLVAGLGACLALLGAAPVAAVQEATPGAAPAGPPLPEGCTVIADGLMNPRYVAVGDDNTIYVTEAGMGGDEVLPPLMPGEGESATPVADAEVIEGPVDTRGFTGQVTAIAPDGTQSVVASGLASYLIGGFEAVGPAGIEVAQDGQLIVAVGGSGPATAFLDPIQYENTVVSIDPATGEITVLADIGAYERANNPDPTAIDSNLYGVGIAEDGTIYVNDAGGNATYLVPAGGGDPELVAVYEQLPIPEGLEAPPGVTGLEPVPTALEFGADGTVLVGFLSGGPFPPGAAKIVNVTPDGVVSDLVTGLTMVVGLAVGPDGQLYASQISTDFLGEMPAPGNVVRVLEDGTQEVVLDGLMFPNGITFDNNGDLIVVVNAVSVGGATGQVLRCEGVAQTSAGSEVEIVLRDVAFRSR